MITRVGAAVLMVGGVGCALAEPGAAQVCWRGRPLPTCRLSVISEAGPRLGTDEPYDPLGYAVALGFMLNGPVGGVGYGGAVQITTSTEGGTYLMTLMPRVRRWLQPAVALDASAGLALLGPGDNPVGVKGGAASLALTYRDLIGLAVGLDHEFPRGGLSARTSVSVGVRFGAFLGPPIALISLVAGAAASGN